MNTLADELLADSGEEDVLEEPLDGDIAPMEVERDTDIDERLRESLKDNDINKVAHLISSERFKSLLEVIV